MLLSLRTPDRTRLAEGNAVTRRRWVKRAEGVSLWLAMLLMLCVHPLYADAAEAEESAVLNLSQGQNGRQQPALILLQRRPAL
jgi:Ca-activated chloride channel family protein